MRPLLIFAHRAEARAFLQGDALSSVPEFAGQLYEGESYYLLLCGEGRLEAIHSTTMALTFLKEKVSKVINLGVCGSLNDKLQKDQIISPKMVLFHDDHEIEFKSFEVQSTEKFNLITTQSRILKDDSREYLSKFGDFVDREFWAIAFSASKFNIPFETHKIVSDIVGDKEICQRVKETSDHFSNLLYQHFQTLEKDAKETDSLEQDLPSGFHFSLSQKRKFFALQSIVDEYDEIITLINNEYHHLREKDKTKLLLEMMSDKSNPFMAKVKNELKELTKDFQNEQYKITFDQNYDSSTFWVNARIDDENDLAQFKSRLMNLPYYEIIKVLEGEF